MVKSFRHSVSEVFGIDKEGRHLMLMGRIVHETKEGEKAEYPYSARLEIDGSGPEPRLKSFQGWSSGI